MRSNSSKVRGVVTAGLVIALGAVAPAGVALAEDEPIVVVAAPEEAPAVEVSEPSTVEPLSLEVADPQADERTEDDGALAIGSVTDPVVETSGTVAADAEPGDLVDTDAADTTDARAGEPAEALGESATDGPAPVTPSKEISTAENPADATAEPSKEEANEAPAPAEQLPTKSNPTPAGFVLTTQVKRDISATQATAASIANTDVAAIGDTGYATLQDAYDSAQAGSTIDVLSDIVLDKAFVIGKSVTINGNGHAVSYSGTGEESSRVVTIDGTNLNITINGWIIKNENPGAYARGVNFNKDCSNVRLELHDCEVSSGYYAINAVMGPEKLDVIIKGCTISGWAAINSWANNSAFTVERSKLYGLNDKTYNAAGWNDFGTIVFCSDYVGAHGSGNTLSINDSTIVARAETGNRQHWINIQNGAINNIVTVDADTNISSSPDENGKGQLENTFIYGYVCTQYPEDGLVCNVVLVWTGSDSFSVDTGITKDIVFTDDNNYSFVGYASEVELPPELAKDGYTFVGWKSAADGEIYSPNAVYIMPVEDARVPFSAAYLKNITNNDVAVYPVGTVSYDGKAQSVVVTDGTVTLVEGVDYTVSYANNVGPGWATALIKGVGAYDDIRTVRYLIQADIADADFADIARQVYAGKAVEPGVSGTFAGSALVEGEDYEVSYAGNDAAGTATVTITGKGNFTGTKVLTFEIADPEPAPAPDAPDDAKHEPNPNPPVPNEPAPAPGTEVADVADVEQYARADERSPVEGVTLNTNVKDMDGIFEDEERAAIAKGSDARVFLTVGEAEQLEDELDAAVRDTVAERFGSDAQLIYLDISLSKWVEGIGTSPIHDTSAPVSITLSLPDELLPADGAGRTYVVVRVHDGRVDLLEATFDAGAGTITFSTDKFSTYGIAYADAEAAEQVAEAAPAPVAEPEPERYVPKHLATTGSRAAAAIPATGDPAVEVYVAQRATGGLGLLSLLAGARRRRRRAR